MMLIYRRDGAAKAINHGNNGGSKAIKHDMNGGIKLVSIKVEVGSLPLNNNFLIITPFAIYVGNCHFTFLAHACIL